LVTTYPEGSVMKVVAHELKQSQIAAVADYLQGLPGR